MEEELLLIAQIRSTLDRVTVCGFDSADRYVGIFQALGRLEQMIAHPEEKPEEKKEVNADG